MGNDQETIARLASSHIQKLCDATGNRHVVGDCAMYTPKSIRAFYENEVCFVTRVPAYSISGQTLSQYDAS